MPLPFLTFLKPKPRETDRDDAAEELRAAKEHAARQIARTDDVMRLLMHGLDDEGYSK